jgi:hypothetical protein
MPYVIAFLVAIFFLTLGFALLKAGKNSTADDPSTAKTIPQNVAVPEDVETMTEADLITPAAPKRGVPVRPVRGSFRRVKHYRGHPIYHLFVPERRRATA